MQEWLASVKSVIERDAPKNGKKPRYEVTDYCSSCKKKKKKKSKKKKREQKSKKKKTLNGTLHARRSVTLWPCPLQSPKIQSQNEKSKEKFENFD